MSIEIGNRIDKLVADPRLSDLMEIAKSGNDAFYLVDPLENQNSDILAWCFNPIEGHDQGDLVFKDFLMAIYNKSITKNITGDLLSGRVDSKKHTKAFVTEWTPSKIAGSSFGSIFCLREYHLAQGGRIDLLIVDPVHKFIIVVENKVGNKLGGEQLEKYYDVVSNDFVDYQKAFVVLDYFHDSDDTTTNDVTNRRWLILDYDWLKIAGRRAAHSISRGSNGASLLKAYCDMLTSGEYFDIHARKLIHALAYDYQDVLQSLKPYRLKSRGNTVNVQTDFWKALKKDDQIAYLLRIYQQNSFIWDQLIDLKPLDLLDFDIRASLNYLADENCGNSRTYLSYQTRGIDSLPLSSDGEWPIYIVAYHKNSRSKDEPLFDVWLLLHQFSINSDAQRNLAIEKIKFAFPKSKINLNADNNRIGISRDLKKADALEAVLKLEKTIWAAFSG